MEQEKRAYYAIIPAVFHRKNKKPWKVTMELDEWLKLYGSYVSLRKFI